MNFKEEVYNLLGYTINENIITGNIECDIRGKSFFFYKRGGLTRLSGSKQLFKVQCNDLYDINEIVNRVKSEMKKNHIEPLKVKFNRKSWSNSECNFEKLVKLITGNYTKADKEKEEFLDKKYDLESKEKEYSKSIVMKEYRNKVFNLIKNEYGKKLPSEIYNYTNQIGFTNGENGAPTVNSKIDFGTNFEIYLNRLIGINNTFKIKNKKVNNL